MSETSSDTESSCGWTLISNEGSDIETLVLDPALEYGTRPAGFPPAVEPDLPVPTAGCFEGKSYPLDDTLLEETFEETMSASEALGAAAAQEHVTLCSSSDLSSSDIVTLGDMKEVEEEVEPAINEESYLGTSSSSQYTFTAVETVLPAPLVTPSSSSSEDEAQGGASTALRRRRPRRNTVVADPPEGEALESGQSEEEEEAEEAEEAEEEEEEEEEEEVLQAQELPGVGVPGPGESGCSLNTCILLVLVVAVSISVGHYYGVSQQKWGRTEWACEDPDAVLEECLRTFFKHEDLAWFPKEDLDHRSFVEMIINISKENTELNTRQTLIQAQSDELVLRLKQGSEERSLMEAQRQRLATEKQQLKSSLEREERSLLALQDELRDLRSEVTELEDRGSAVDPLVLENQRLVEQLEEKKALTRGVLSQRDAAMAETRSLRKELDRERRFTEELREEMDRLGPAAAGAEESQAEIQTRLTELEKRLGFEQQRSDLWERLYVESKEEKAKGDTEPRVQKTKEGMAGKVKKTFEAVKNSTKEFVHHHKEQIKKAKQAVKENLRKFSDSVKSTFRHFKDSASTFITKATAESSKRFTERDAKGPWDAKGPSQQGPHQPQHGRSSGSSEGFKSSQNTRKSGDKVQDDRDTQNHRESPKRGSRVFHSGFKGSQSLFGKGMEPVRADEFNQLLQSYLHQEVDHFHHWKELEKFIHNFFHHGVFIHDQMLFKDFVSRLEDYLENMHEYYGLDDGVFADLEQFIYRHFYGESYTKSYGPSRPTEGADKQPRESLQPKQQQQRRQQRARSRPQRERKCSRSGGNADRHMADVKIELGPMPFDPKY